MTLHSFSTSRARRARRTMRACLTEVVGIGVCVLALGACNVAETMRDLADQPATAHERYARSLEKAGLSETALGREWLVAGDSALRAPMKVALPFREAGFYSRSEARAVAYRVALREGERLDVSVQARGLRAQLFVDLYEETTDTLAPFVHRATAESAEDDTNTDSARNARGGDSARKAPGTDGPRSTARADSVAASLALRYEVGRTGTYILRVQPELLRDGRYELSAGIQPTLAFPVEGGGNRAVQSYYGAERDAGRRQHQGIDIFAPRGTPALAATDGVVRSTSPNQLGGNVVWLSDTRRGQTMYYAHLDRHAVSAGDVVRAGDTLGFVGNTGNARTTRPHLHFGIYRRGQGAIDPYPYVRLVTAKPPALTADTSRLGTRARTAVANTALRIAPSTSGDTVRRVARNTPVQIVGATGGWYRVQLADGVAGYVVARATRDAPRDEAARLPAASSRAGQD